MTIAACYLSPEGVVLGADSTSSALISPEPGFSGFHYFNHGQKLFELGENGTAGVLTWGLGSFNQSSYRTLVALLADELVSDPPKDFFEVASRFTDRFWDAYQASFGQFIARCQQLAAKPPHDPANNASRTPEEEAEFQNWARNLVVGFCVAGYWLPDRTAAAFQIVFDPLSGKPTPQQMPNGTYSFWGAPNVVKRLISGGDDNLRAALLNSGHWTGTPDQLDQVLANQVIGHPMLPIRDAVDFVHSCIYSTIKAMKFSNLFQVCGGPIELAVITSDRRFRWVRHKTWDAAITEG